MKMIIKIFVKRDYNEDTSHYVVALDPKNDIIKV